MKPSGLPMSPTPHDEDPYSNHPTLDHAARWPETAWFTCHSFTALEALKEVVVVSDHSNEAIIKRTFNMVNMFLREYTTLEMFHLASGILLTYLTATCFQHCLEGAEIFITCHQFNKTYQLTHSIKYNIVDATLAIRKLNADPEMFPTYWVHNENTREIYLNLYSNHKKLNTFFHCSR